MQKSKRLEILEASLIKKEASLNAKFETHFDSVRQANGQPLNDKRNGQATLNKWERQNEAIRNQKKSIEKTKNAIEREKNKISGVEYAKETFPACILEMLESGQLIQWRKHPNTFFVKNVDKARICWDDKNKLIFTRYKDAITDKDVWKIFATTFNTLLKQIQDEQKGTS